ncbi:ubiquitin-conjugating enzyme E2 W [Mortierella sp. GBA35]|nr:ubiquitin-conjugating enzyme E2 W [Mortierella sp. GBA35]
MAKPMFARRLSKELKDLAMNPPAGVNIIDANDFKVWKLGLAGAPGTLYEGEKFELEFNFGPNYPLESPQVLFIGDNVPVHPHIYSNGHICLDVLYQHWSPVQTVASICLSLQSMLSSCTSKEPPPDNATYVKTARANPKHTAWAFHDDTV